MKLAGIFVCKSESDSEASTVSDRLLLMARLGAEYLQKLRPRDFLFPIVLAWVTMPRRGKALASHPEFFPTTGDE